MKFITFKRQSTLIKNRLERISEHATTLSELATVEEKHKQRALSLDEDTSAKQKEYNTIRDNLLNTPNSVDETEETELSNIDSTIGDLLLTFKLF